MPQSGDFSLYIHVPFCTKKCDYCHFFVLPNQLRFQQKYVTALRQEWLLREPLLQQRQLVSIYFGGGTPSLLPIATLEQMLQWIQPDATVEITLEANPERLTLDALRQLRAIGINRLSIGVQTFDATLLKTLTRTHSAYEAEQSILWAAAAGFENISIDLMYDLPHQTLTQWQQSLKQAASLPISHLSFYNLTLEPHTVFYKKREQLTAYLPSQERSVEMLQWGCDFLQQSGLKRYEISAFAKEGYESRHNSGYWNGRPFLGLGPSAFSYWDHKRFCNHAHLNRYAEALERGEMPIAFSEELCPEARERELLAIGLRRLQGMPLQEHEEIAALIEEGFLEQEAAYLRLTAKGLLFYDTVASRLI